MGNKVSESAYNEEEPGPTVLPYDDFNSEEDCENLKNAMAGFGTDDQAIIDIIGYRSNEQRQQIKLDYKSLFGKDLIEDISSEISGKFEDVMLALFMTPVEYDASELRRAMCGAGTDNDCLIEIMCTRTNEQIIAIREAYTRVYERDLEEDLINDTAGPFKNLMVSTVQANRDEANEVDEDQAAQDAQDLFNAGIESWGTDESEFNVILAKRSFPHLRLVFAQYLDLTGRSLADDISAEISGDFRDGLLTIAAVVKNRVGYYADKLWDSMQGAGTSDESLIRVVVTRCEVDMVQIKKFFLEKYETTVFEAIKGDCSGDYKRILQTLVGPD